MYFFYNHSHFNFHLKTPKKSRRGIEPLLARPEQAVMTTRPTRQLIFKSQTNLKPSPYTKMMKNNRSSNCHI